MNPELIGALVGGGLVSGVVVTKVWCSVFKNGGTNGKVYHTSPCEPLQSLINTTTEIAADIRWMKKEQEQDSTAQLLDGILKHLTQKEE